MSVETAEREPAGKQTGIAPLEALPLTTRYQLQPLRVLATGAVLAVGVLIAYFWRNHQVLKNAGAILDRGAAFATAGKWPEAATAYHQYLRLRPDDADVAVQLAKAVAETALTRTQQERAVELHFRAIRSAPDHIETHKRLARLLIDVERYADAEQQAKWLLARDADDLASLRLLSVAQLKQIGANFRVSAADVAKTHRSALNKHAGDVELSVALAELYRRNAESLPGATPRVAGEAADKIIDEMVAANSEDYKAHLARYRYRGRFDLPGKTEDLQAAATAGPDVPEVLLATIEQAWRDGQPEAALSYAERLVAAAPTDRRVYLVKGEAHLRLGDQQRALELWRRGLQLVGADDFDFNRAIFRVQLDAGRFDEADQILDTLDSTLRRLGPLLSAVTRRRLLEDVELLRAQSLVARGDSRTAVPLIKRIAAGHTQYSDLELDAAIREQQWTLLSQAHAALLRFDLAAEAAEEAAKVNPKSSSARLFAAAAWQRAGQTDAAVQQYKAVLAADKPPKEALAGLANLYLRRELARSENSRDWLEFEQLMGRAKTLFGQDSVLQVIEVEAALARGDRDGGMALLEALRAGSSVDARSLVSAALLYETAGNSAQADRTIEQLAALPAGDESQLALVRAEILTARREFDDARKVLEQIQEKVAPRLRPAVTQRLADLDVQCGQPDLARQRLRELSASHSKDLTLLESVASMAHLAGDLNELQSCENRLRDLEGPGGTSWKYFQGLRLVAAAKTATDEGLATAEQLQAQIAQSRPTWPGAYMLRGRIADRRGLTEQAVNDYQEAIRLGNRSVAAVEWLVSGLYRLGRFTEAGRYVAQLGDFVALSPVLTDAAIPTYVRTGKTDQAVEIAKAAVRSRPNDPMAHLRLGQSLALVNKFPEADAAFKRAKELAPDDLRTRAGLIWFLARAGRTDEARQAIETLTSGLELPVQQAELALAQGYELIADRKHAEQHYLAAAAAAQDNADVHARLGRFYLQSDPMKAEREFRRVLELSPQAHDARRILATLIAARGGQSEWEEALQLLRAGGAARSEDSQDRRLEAVLRSRRGGEQNSKAAAAILSDLIESDANPQPSDRLLLARIREADGQFDAAKSQLLALTEGGSPPPAYIAVYVDFLLRHSKTAEAESWLKRLDEAEPDGINRISLRCKWLDLLGRGAEIEPLLENTLQQRLATARSDSERGQTFQDVAAIYDRLGKLEQAERCLRKLQKATPQGYLPLVRWLMEKNRQPEAIQVCQHAAQQDPGPRPAIALAQLLTMSAGKSVLDSELQDQAERMLADCVQANPADQQLLFDVATLRYMQGRTAESISVYQQILQSAPNHAATLNNLAVVLSEQDDRKSEAIQCIERAIASAGASAELMDTRALVLLNIGMAADAHRLLEQLVHNWPDNARYQFHIALTAHKTGAAQAARDALKTATERGLADEFLSPRERQLLAQLEQDLKSPASGAAVQFR